MKKIGLLMGVVILATLLLIQPAFAQSFPEVRGYVNDFASIIPDGAEQRLEQKLNDYKTKTTNEIAVVTVKSLGGLTIEDYGIRLAEKWKVGKKGKDNGVILLVASNERKVRIEVGYGLEGVLTDARAKIITERAIIPEFKAGNFSAGIEKGVEQIIGAITPRTSPVPPVNTTKTVKSDSGGGWIALFIFAGIALTIGLIIFVVWIVKIYKRRQAETRRREAVRGETRKLLESLEIEKRRVSAVIEKLSLMNQYPKRLLEEKKGFELRRQYTTKDEELCREAVGLLKERPDDALSKAKEAGRTLVGVKEVLEQFLERLTAFDRARNSDEFQQAELAIAEVQLFLNSLEGRGYKVSPEKELEESLKELAPAKKIILQRDEVPDYELISVYARSALRKISDIMPKWQRVLNLQNENETALKNLLTWYVSLPELQKKSEADLGELKKNVPGEVWKPIEDNIKAMEAIPEKILFRIENISLLNSMSVQDFSGTSKAIRDITIEKKNYENFLEQPARILQKWIQAKSQIDSLSGNMPNLFRDAERVFRDPDAGNTGRSKLEQAKVKSAEAEGLKKVSSPNWIIIAGLLTTAIELAGQAEREAENRASDVKEARRRKREEEEEEERRKKRRREDEERKRRDDSYHSSSSWSSSSSSSGSSFGGFGGGSFGGGGASGSW